MKISTLRKLTIIVISSCVIARYHRDIYPAAWAVVVAAACVLWGYKNRSLRQTLVFESCNLSSIEEHSGGCDANVEYGTLRMGTGVLGRKWTTLNAAGAKRLALYVSGAGTSSEWASKIDNTVLRDLTKDEMRGATDILQDGGDISISIDLYRFSNGDIMIESVIIENDVSSLCTRRAASHSSIVAPSRLPAR